MTNSIRKVCSRDPSHDISPAGPSGQFCPVCGSKLIEIVIDDTSRDEDDRDRSGRWSRTTLTLAIGGGLLAAGVGVFLMWPAKPSSQRLVVANVLPDRGCRLQNVVVTFWREGHGMLEGRALGNDGVTLIDYRLAQGPAPTRQMTVEISAVLNSGGSQVVGTAVFNRQAPVASIKSFHYPPSLFEKIVDAKVEIRCAM